MFSHINNTMCHWLQFILLSSTFYVRLVIILYVDFISYAHTYCVHNQLACIQQPKGKHSYFGFDTDSLCQLLNDWGESLKKAHNAKNPSHVLVSILLVFTLHIHICVQLFVVHLGGYHIHAEYSIRWLREKTKAVVRL